MIFIIVVLCLSFSSILLLSVSTSIAGIVSEHQKNVRYIYMLPKEMHPNSPSSVKSLFYLYFSVFTFFVLVFSLYFIYNLFGFIFGSLYVLFLFIVLILSSGFWVSSDYKKPMVSFYVLSSIVAFILSFFLYLLA